MENTEKLKEMHNSYFCVNPKNQVLNESSLHYFKSLKIFTSKKGTTQLS